MDGLSVHCFSKMAQTILGNAGHSILDIGRTDR